MVSRSCPQIVAVGRSNSLLKNELIDSRDGEAVAAELEGVIEATAGRAEVVDTTTYLQAGMIGADAYAQRAGDSALLALYSDLRSNPEAHFLSLSLGPSRAVAAIVGNFSSGFELRALPPAVEEPAELRFARDGDRFVLSAEFTAREQSAADRVSVPRPRLRCLAKARQ